MSPLSGHAGPMHVHPHPPAPMAEQVCAGPHWVLMCALAGWGGRRSCALPQTQSFKSNSTELELSVEHGGNTGSALSSGKKKCSCCRLLG